jgi:predicted transcriptional regulator
VRIQLTQQSLLEKMTEKMKQMADRLSAVESYKALCENRIRDLDPSHDLPVIPQHLGQRPVNMQNADAIHSKLNEVHG